MSNIWNIKENMQEGPNCPVMPINLPFYKRAWLFLFRFGLCPLCMLSSVSYSIAKAFKATGNKTGRH
ncbi:MAG: hypothetical protein H7289_12625 [Mucilaginibacter sp.]|nr:hypothetical protein [Mucilaginibacter sp.]